MLPLIISTIFTLEISGMAYSNMLTDSYFMFIIIFLNIMLVATLTKDTATNLRGNVIVMSSLIFCFIMFGICNMSFYFMAEYDRILPQVTSYTISNVVYCFLIAIVAKVVGVKELNPSKEA
tara:strand:+ start:105 stop:467 length:363 start_codon:yes stop_codon:yes gene_type:complete